jgi:hypothetical protein
LKLRGFDLGGCHEASQLLVRQRARPKEALVKVATPFRQQHELAGAFDPLDDHLKIELTRKLDHRLDDDPVALAVPVVHEFLKTGLVPRLPTAVLSMGLMVLSFLSLTCGLVLATVTRGRIETKRLQYLSLPAGAVDSTRSDTDFGMTSRVRQRRAP